MDKHQHRDAPSDRQENPTPRLQPDMRSPEHQRIFAQRTEASHSLQQAGFPHVELGDFKSQYQHTLLDSSASVQDRLKAAEALASAGVKELAVPDGKGTQRLRLEVENAGHRKMVHVFSQDAHGREHVLMRGIDDGNGKFEQEQDRHGRKVSFTAHAWQSPRDTAAGPSRRQSDVTGGQKTNQGADQPVQPAQPDTIPTPRPRPQMPQNADQPTSPENAPTPRPRPEIIQPAQLPRDVNGRAQDNQPPAQESLNNLFDRAANACRRLGAGGGSSSPVCFRSKMDVDADGSPRARQIDPDGSVHTSLRDENGHSINAEHVPYIVLPGGKYQHLGIHLGDVAAVRYNGQVHFAVFADVGPKHKLGEGSMELARQLGMSPSPTHGGTHRQAVEYMVFPGSRHGRPANPSLTDEVGKRLLMERGGF